MTAFKGLYIKDLKLSLVLFLTGMVLINVLTLLSLGLKEYFQEPMIPAILFIIALVAHVFYLPVMLLSSLQQEGKGQQWLHNPNSSMKLLLAKLSACLTYSAVSIIITALLCYFALNGVVSTRDFVELLTIQDYLIVISGMIVVTSSYFSLWVILFWTLYHSLKNVPVINRFRPLVLVALWLTLSAIENYFRRLPIFQVYTEERGLSITLMGGIFSAEAMEIQLLNIFIYLLIAILLFFTSVWLLERKVEV